MGFGYHDAINDMLFLFSPAPGFLFDQVDSAPRSCPSLFKIQSQYSNVCASALLSVARLSIYVLFIEILPFSFRDPRISPGVMSNLPRTPMAHDLNLGNV